MSATLSKTQFPVRRDLRLPVRKVVLFYQVDSDDGDYYRDVTIDAGLWYALGEPNELTVTIEPGDILNER